MKINGISPNINQLSLTNKDNTDFGFKDIVRDMKKAKQSQENTVCPPQVERRLEQVWLHKATQLPTNNIKAINSNSFADIVNDAVNLLSTDEIESLINEITEDETGERIDVKDLEYCLDLFTEVSGRKV